MSDDPPPIVTTARLIRQALAANVRRERQRAGLSQHALAERSLVSRGTIMHVEKAEQEPRLSTLAAFSTALNIPLDRFLVGLEAIAASGGDRETAVS